MYTLAAYHFLHNRGAFRDGGFLRIEHFVSARDALLIHGITLRLPRVEERAKLAFLEPTDVANLDLALVRLWDPKRVAKARVPQL